MKRLSRDEVQVCMHFLDLTSLLSLALCSKRLHHDADSEVAWRHVPGKVVVKDWPMIPETTLVRHHRAIVRHGCDIYRRIPDSISTRVHELVINVEGSWGVVREVAAAILACCNIKILRLIGNGFNTALKAAVLEALGSNKQLCELYIGNMCGDMGTNLGKLVSKCPNIRTLDVSGHGVPLLLEGLAGGHNLGTLRILAPFIDIPRTRYIRAIAAVLRSPSLTSFKYQLYQTRDMNWIEFAKVIADAPALTSLDLSDNLIGLSDNRIWKGGAEALCIAAQASKTLQHLILKNDPKDIIFLPIGADDKAELMEKYANHKGKFKLVL
jgi:hypothetical protein